MKILKILFKVILTFIFFATLFQLFTALGMMILRYTTIAIDSTIGVNIKVVIEIVAFLLSLFLSIKSFSNRKYLNGLIIGVFSLFTINFISIIVTAVLLKHDSNSHEKDINKSTLENRSKEVSKNILLIPNDVNRNMVVLAKHNMMYKKFKNRRENFKKNIKIEQLIDFYLDALDESQEKSYTSSMQILSRVNYEMNLLLFLKRDLEENPFLSEERRELFETIEELLFFDNGKIYKVIEAQNKFYANNIKKYIDLEMKNSTDKSIRLNEKSYEKFLFYLDKGEKLLFEAIEKRDFCLYDKFIKDEVTISEEESNRLCKSLKDENIDEFFTLSTLYWIRIQIFMRYRGADYLSLIDRIEEEREFFESMYSETAIRKNLLDQ